MGGVGILAHSDIELSVFPEVYGTTVVVGGAAQIIQIQSGDFATGDRDVAVGCEAADPIVDRRCRGCVVDVNKFGSLKKSVGKFWFRKFTEHMVERNFSRFVGAKTV